jgi:uncharacterized protein (UPF0261 family)
MQGVLDITTTEVADHIVGGVMACDESRFDAVIENKIPLVLSVGALDMVNFGARDTIPPPFAGRKIHVHNEQVSVYICPSSVFHFTYIIKYIPIFLARLYIRETMHCL